MNISDLKIKMEQAGIDSQKIDEVVDGIEPVDNSRLKNNVAPSVDVVGEAKLKMLSEEDPLKRAQLAAFIISSQIRT